MKSCDVYPPNPVSSTRICYDYPWASLKPGSVVYIISSAIPDFRRKGLPLIRVPFVLVSGDCDETTPTDLFTTTDDLRSFLEDPRLLAWFAQNMVALRTHPKLRQIPIGMDYHTLSVQKNTHPWGPQQTPQQQETMLDMIRLRMKGKPRAMTAHANFQFSMRTRYAVDRQDALRLLNKDLVVYEETPVKRVSTWIHQANHQFVISPHGGGLDCHRTWEALALGCYPIVKTSPLDPLFQGLPVLIVDSWASLTQDRMKEFLEKQTTADDSIEPLLLKYWTDQIRLATNALPESLSGSKE